MGGGGWGENGGSQQILNLDYLKGEKNLQKPNKKTIPGHTY